MENNDMVHARVLRANAATCGGMQGAPEVLVEHLNDEFSLLGGRIQRQDLQGRCSAPDIAQFLERKIQ